MPKKGLYKIVLSSEEAQQLSAQTRKYTLPYFQVQRAKIVLLAAEGLENDDIACRLDTPRKVVWFWRKRFFEKRVEGLDDLPRSGRPRAFPPRGGHRGKGAGM